MSAIKYFKKIMLICIYTQDNTRSTTSLLPECSVGNPEQRQLKHAWQLLVCSINSRLLTGSTN